MDSDGVAIFLTASKSQSFNPSTSIVDPTAGMTFSMIPEVNDGKHVAAPKKIEKVRKNKLRFKLWPIELKFYAFQGLL